jgi:hypothetical protein
MPKKEKRMQSCFLRGRIWLLTAVSGGGLFVLGGCDPTVRDTVLAGVESATTTLVTTFITAFFQSVLTAGEEATVTTVKAVIEHVPEFFA